jgi:hypothetical protein
MLRTSAIFGDDLPGPRDRILTDDEIFAFWRNLTINLDGETMAQSVIKWITKNSMFEFGAPASDGSKSYGP